MIAAHLSSARDARSIGLARTINLTTFFFLSGDVGRLFGTTPGNDARAWSIAPTLSWSAFDLGSVRARLRASEAQSDAAAASYEKVVLTAIEDTENWHQVNSRTAPVLPSIA
jgi:outer membrane protein TolC